MCGLINTINYDYGSASCSENEPIKEMVKSYLALPVKNLVSIRECIY